MNQKETTRKVLFELIQYGVVDPYYSKIVEQYLNQIYSAGYNSGSKVHAVLKPVIKLNKHGEHLGEYESLRAAAKKNDIQHGNISSCIKGNRMTAGGYYWKLKNV